MTHDNSDRFLAAFSRIEQSLRKMTKSSKQDSFGTLLDRATSATIRRFSNDLREFAELRNAIVHERGGGYVIAEPHPETVHRQIGPHDISTVRRSCDTLDVHPHPRLKESPLCHQQPYWRYRQQSKLRCAPYSAVHDTAIFSRSIS